MALGLGLLSRDSDDEGVTGGLPLALLVRLGMELCVGEGVCGGVDDSVGGAEGGGVPLRVPLCDTDALGVPLGAAVPLAVLAGEDDADPVSVGEAAALPVPVTLELIDGCGVPLSVPLDVGVVLDERLCVARALRDGELDMEADELVDALLVALASAVGVCVGVALPLGSLELLLVGESVPDAVRAGVPLALLVALLVAVGLVLTLTVALAEVQLGRGGLHAPVTTSHTDCSGVALASQDTHDVLMMYGEDPSAPTLTTLSNVSGLTAGATQGTHVGYMPIQSPPPRGLQGPVPRDSVVFTLTHRPAQLMYDVAPQNPAAQLYVAVKGCWLTAPVPIPLGVAFTLEPGGGVGATHA